VKYSIKAKVDQIVTKEIQLLVVAGSEEEALEKARDALQTYPAAVETDGIERLVTNKAHYWIPRSIDFVKVKKEKDTA